MFVNNPTEIFFYSSKFRRRKRTLTQCHWVMLLFWIVNINLNLLGYLEFNYGWLLTLLDLSKLTRSIQKNPNHCFMLDQYILCYSNILIFPFLFRRLWPQWQFGIINPLLNTIWTQSSLCLPQSMFISLIVEIQKYIDQ